MNDLSLWLNDLSKKYINEASKKMKQERIINEADQILIELGIRSKTHLHKHHKKVKIHQISNDEIKRNFMSAIVIDPKQQLEQSSIRSTHNSSQCINISPIIKRKKRKINIDGNQNCSVNNNVLQKNIQKSPNENFYKPFPIFLS